MSVVLDVLAVALAGAALAGIGYQITAARATRRFVGLSSPQPVSRPAVTILKPLCGDEPGLEELLASFCTQDWPEVQVVFGVQNRSDPAIAVVERVRARFPDADIALVVDETQHGPNLKVGNLINMWPSAKHDVIIIADSDMRVAPDYVSAVVATLEEEQVGIVTCLYVGEPTPKDVGGGIWSRLGAMGVNHGFLPSVLVAQKVGRVDGCFGATMALSRDMLASIGGLQALADKLADDHAIGAFVRARGHRIGLARHLVHTSSHEPSFGALARHELRWSRTVANIAPSAYIASVVTQPVALSVLALGLARGAYWALAVAVAALAVRLWAVRVEERALGLPAAPVWLVAARDLLSFAVFAAAHGGHSVTWRGRTFKVDRQGNLVPVGE